MNGSVHPQLPSGLIHKDGEDVEKRKHQQKIFPKRIRSIRVEQKKTTTYWVSK